MKMKETGDVRKKRMVERTVVVLASILLGIFFSPVSATGSKVFMPQAGIYLSFAKSMKAGQLLYRDLLDHKGILQFVPGILCNEMSGTSPIPYLLLNIAARCTLFLEVRWFLERNSCLKMPVLVQTLLSEVLVTAIAFNFNDFLLADMFFVGVYLYAADYVKQNDVCKKKGFLLLGILIGMVTNAKLPLALYFVPLFLHFFARAVKKQKGKAAIPLLLGILGFGTAWIPQVWYNTHFHVWNEFFASFHGVKASKAVLVCSVILCFALSFYTAFFATDTAEKDLFAIGVLGNFSAFSFAPYLFAPLTLLWGLLEVSMEKVNKRGMAALLGLCVVYAAFFGYARIEYDSYKPTKEVAKEYGITNDNLIYLGEDYGYGAYSESPYRRGASSIMARFLEKENIKDLSLRRTPIVEREEFEYLCVASMMEDIWENSALEAAVREHYELVEKLPASDLYKRKPSR